MTDRLDVTVVRRPGRTCSADDGPAPLLAAYHLRTEAEKGAAVADVDELPERYRRETTDPGTVFADDMVLMALLGDAAVGCLVVTAPADGRSEIKRLWTDPAVRGRGVASGLLDSAFEHARENGVGVLRLSVWDWRTGAVALYERFGFAVTESWDEREGLVCMERAV
jgi:putative acetyltransferase